MSTPDDTLTNPLKLAQFIKGALADGSWGPEMAEMVLKQVDDDPTIIPQLPLDVGALTVWALECTLINGGGTTLTTIPTVRI